MWDHTVAENLMLMPLSTLHYSCYNYITRLVSGNIYASIQLYSPILAGLFSNKCIKTELEYMLLWREGIEHRSRALIVYLISNWGWKHKIRIFVACWMCRKLRAFYGDQTDPKFVCGGPKSILRTGIRMPVITFVHPQQLEKVETRDKELFR